MSSSSSASIPVVTVRQQLARKTKRSKHKPKPLLWSSEDCSFIGYGSFPFMDRHVSNEQTVRLQGSLVITAFNTTSLTVNTYASASFSLGGFGATTGFTNALACFDQYKIDLIETWLVSRDPTAVNNSNPGLLATCVDLDDATVPTSFNVIQSYGSSLTTSGAAGHYHRWVPHIAVAAYGGAFTSYSNMGPQWIDSGSPAVQHYGLKLAALPTGSAIATDLIVRATVTFRAIF
jgi:hypothetical protein